MNNYVTGDIIKEYREAKKLTQAELAELLHVSSKAVSKWESGRGFPDVSILEELARVLGITITELFTGGVIENTNPSANMLRSSFYVCPICGNLITSVGEAFVSCHGIRLVKEEATEGNLQIERIEDEFFIQIDSPMTKQDYISFVCGVSSDSIELKKLYPEQSPLTRLKRRGVRKIYYYSNREGLFYSLVR